MSMTKSEFKNYIEKWAADGAVILDGATGSNLQKVGMMPGMAPEKWMLDNSDKVVDLQIAYINEGTKIVTAPTFTANRLKLAEYEKEFNPDEINRKLVEISKRAVKESGAEDVLVSGNMSMLGVQIAPVGILPFEEAVGLYKEQAKALYDAGVDIIYIETMMSLQECRAALIAAKEVCDLPVMVSVTYERSGRTLFGTDPTTAAIVLEKLGADVIGVNCSSGPEDLYEIVSAYRNACSVPILAKPNAGLPKLVDGKTIFEMGPEEFAEKASKLAEAGASLIGGCCGTTPEHIGALSRKLAKIDKTALSGRHDRKGINKPVICSETQTVVFDRKGRFVVIGERINPTGKKALKAALLEGDTSLAVDMAVEQEEKGAGVLDVNAGMPGIDEAEMLAKLVNDVSAVTRLPLSIDSGDPVAVERALRIYPGRALINSVSLEKERVTKILPLAKKYGAMVVLLPLSEKGLPKDVNEKREYIKQLYEEAVKVGLDKNDLIVDPLVNTVGANIDAANETLAAVDMIYREFEMCSVAGLSNVSYGLPERSYMNAAFLAMAVREGLSAAIMNPLQDILMNFLAASEFLCGKPDSDMRYIERAKYITENAQNVQKVPVAATQTAVAAGEANASKEVLKTGEHSPAYEAVLKGRKDTITDIIAKELLNKKTPAQILNGELIPAINEVGDLFGRQKYFLPQLIASAEAMQIGINMLEEKLGDACSAKKGKIVIATVEGDIHDIGKNLVAVMLKNNGYEVFDLGKDVKAETIIDKAIEVDADIIAVSALMTTTMVRMRDVVELRNKKQLRTKIMIGGAVTTPEYAKEIGAEGYSENAAEAVLVADRLIGIVH